MKTVNSINESASLDAGKLLLLHRKTEVKKLYQNDPAECFKYKLLYILLC